LITREIRNLRRTLGAFDRVFRRLTPIISAAVNREEAVGPKAPRRRPRLTAKARAALKLQGQYMGYMRQLKP
jgi:hypothetical protein